MNADGTLANGRVWTRRHAIAAGTFGMAGIAGAVETELAEIVRFAEESPEPEDSTLCEHIYVNMPGCG